MGVSIAGLDEPIAQLKDIISEQNRFIIRLQKTGAPPDVIMTAKAISIVLNEIVESLDDD